MGGAESDLEFLQRLSHRGKVPLGDFPGGESALELARDPGSEFPDGDRGRLSFEIVPVEMDRIVKGFPVGF